MNSIIERDYGITFKSSKITLILNHQIKVFRFSVTETYLKKLISKP